MAKVVHCSEVPPEGLQRGRVSPGFHLPKLWLRGSELSAVTQQPPELPWSPSALGLLSSWGGEVPCLMALSSVKAQHLETEGCAVPLRDQREWSLT